MYFFPSYVTYEERSGSVYISSKLLQNEIKISDSAFIQEFQDLIAKGGCSTLSTSLTQFLHDQDFLSIRQKWKHGWLKPKHYWIKNSSLRLCPQKGAISGVHTAMNHITLL